MATLTGDVWPKILMALREDLPDRTVKNWFEIASVDVRDSRPVVLQLTLPSSYHREHIRDRYYSSLQAAGREVLDQHVEVEFRIDDEQTGGGSRDGSDSPSSVATDENARRKGRREEEQQIDNNNGQSSQPRSSHGARSTSSPTIVERGPLAGSRGRSRGETSSAKPTGLHRSRVGTALKGRYTFDAFVEGDSNALARSASAAVADNPGGTNYNPLLIHGGVGLGKTHLAQAIANHAISHETAEFICYKSGEEFTSEFVQAIRNGEGDKFSKKYRGVDLLILDDIQFFEGKEKTQEEFFHLFNALYQQNKQIVLCADRPPTEIDGIEGRLLSRFEWGLSTDVQRPTLETRLAILRVKAETLGLEVEPEVLDLMAESITTNVRELEGALKQLSARANLIGTKIDADTARRILEDQIRLPESTPISMEEILNAVTAYYGVSRDDLIGRSRHTDVVHPRHVAMYLARELLSLSLSAIGRRFGGRDHSTVSHACEKVSGRLDVRPEMETELKDVRREVQRHATRS